ncbi:MAG: hypothetical protein Q9200_005268 [Gallowayella weberi]
MEARPTPPPLAKPLLLQMDKPRRQLRRARPQQGAQRPSRQVKEPLSAATRLMLLMLPKGIGRSYVESKMSTHWRWVLMLIILVLGFTALAVGGVYLKRYIHRRRDAQEAMLAGPRQDLHTWGPGQSVHEIGAPVVATTNPEREKGKDIEMVQTPEATNDRRNSRRLKKFLPGRG